MYSIVSLFIFLLASTFAGAKDVALTIEELDNVRQRASLMVVDQTEVPLNTVFRVHGKTGTCKIRITEKVNDHLVAATQGCDTGIIRPGMKLAYTTTDDFPARTPQSTESQLNTSYKQPTLINKILERTSVFVGHNFATELEGNVRADGSERNLSGDTALSMGLRGRVYDFSPRFSLAAELGYESPRTFDQATFTNPDGFTQTLGTRNYSPRLAMWSLAALAEAKVMERMVAFGGLNLTIPLLSNSPFSMESRLGFQGGAFYKLLPNVAIEGLIKISNMALENNIGETTDVSVAGLEVRGRYFF